LGAHEKQLSMSRALGYQKYSSYLATTKKLCWKAKHLITILCPFAYMCIYMPEGDIWSYFSIKE